MEVTHPTHSLTQAQLTAETALFQGQVTGFVVSCFENERPLQGLIGFLDWRFSGQISYYVRKGFLTGRAGECVYLPIRKQGKVYHLIVAGGGTSPFFGARPAPVKESFQLLKKNLKNSGLTTLGISRSDFGSLSDEAIQQELKGLPICVLQ